MNFKNVLVAAALVAAGVTGFAGQANAQSESANVEFEGTVDSLCVISGSTNNPLDLDSDLTTLSGEGPFTVACTDGGKVSSAVTAFNGETTVALDDITSIVTSGGSPIAGEITDGTVSISAPAPSGEVFQADTYTATVEVTVTPN